MHGSARTEWGRRAAPRRRLLHQLPAPLPRRIAVRVLRGRRELEVGCTQTMKGIHTAAIAALAAYTGGAMASHRRDSLAVRTYIHERDIWLDAVQWRIIRAELVFGAVRWPLGPPHPVTLVDAALAAGVRA